MLGWRLRLIGALIVVCSLPPAGDAAAAAGACRSVVAYRPGGVAVRPRPRVTAPVLCASSTGFAGAESHIVARPGGAVVYTPAVLPSGVVGSGEGPPLAPGTQANASPAGMAVTRDRGRRWSLVRPDGVTWNPTDHAEYVDPSTGRLFYEDYGPIPLAAQFGALQEGPAYVMWSDDLKRWHAPALLGVVLPENPRFTAAPAPAGRPRPAGYPDVVYLCLNTNIGFIAPAILGRVCYRSLDGGSSWTKAAQLLSGLLPVHHECGLAGEDFWAADGYYPTAAPGGDLYVLVSCGGRTFLARSDDEAASFPVIHTAAGALRVPVPSDSGAQEIGTFPALGDGPQLMIDRSGTMYVVYPQVIPRSIATPATAGTIARLELIASPDQGRRWTRPIDVTPLGAAALLRWTAAARPDGRLLIAAVCRRRAEATWHGCLERIDGTRGLVRARAPRIWAGTLPGAPLLYGDTIEGAGNVALGEGQIEVPDPFPLGIDPIGGLVSAGNDFIGATFAADGTGWASFNRDCGPTPRSPGCAATGGQTRGVAASLRRR